MFGKYKKSIDELHNTIKQLEDRVFALEMEKRVLKKEFNNLKKQVAEQSNKTLSQMTTQPEEQVPFAQIVDEWINGSEGEDNGN